MTKIQTPKFFTAYNTPEGPTLTFPEETQTKKAATVQSAKDECDVNQILKRYETTGVLEHTRQFNGQYGDFSEIGDFQSAMQSVQVGREIFDTLPAQMREIFNNDPGNFLDAVVDPDRNQELVELGILEGNLAEASDSDTPASAPADATTETGIAAKPEPVKSE